MTIHAVDADIQTYGMLVAKCEDMRLLDHELTLLRRLRAVYSDRPLEEQLLASAAANAAALRLLAVGRGLEKHDSQQSDQDSVEGRRLGNHQSSVGHVRHGHSSQDKRFMPG